MHTCACMACPLTLDKAYTQKASATFSLEEKPHSQHADACCRTSTTTVLSTCHCPCRRMCTVRHQTLSFHICHAPCWRRQALARPLAPPVSQSIALPLMRVQALLEGGCVIRNGKTLCRTSLAGDAPHSAPLAPLTPSLFLCAAASLNQPLGRQLSIVGLRRTLPVPCCKIVADITPLRHGKDIQQCSRYGTEPRRSLLSHRGLKCELCTRSDSLPLAYFARSNAVNHCIPGHPSERKTEEKKCFWTP